MSASLKLIIPVYNEAENIAQVIADFHSVKSADFTLSEIIVADNNSNDGSAEIARESGATVVRAEIQGYGAACQAGISAIDNCDYVVFADGDGSDLPSDLTKLYAKAKEGYDLVLGSRIAKGSARLPFHQRYGNLFAGFLMSLKYGQRVKDLGPFRIIDYAALQSLKMKDLNYGWTIEMQIKAFKIGLKVAEVPVAFRNRQGGKSKISGTLKGSYYASKIILTYLFKDLCGKLS